MQMNIQKPCVGFKQFFLGENRSVLHFEFSDATDSKNLKALFLLKRRL